MMDNKMMEDNLTEMDSPTEGRIQKIDVNKQPFLDSKMSDINSNSSSQNKNSQQSISEQKKRKGFQLSDTMIENVVQDFIPACIEPMVYEIKRVWGANSPSLFFMLVYCAADNAEERYSAKVKKYFQATGDNEERVEAFLLVVNKLLRCDNLQALKTIGPYEYIDKIQPVKNDEEAREAVRQIQAIMRPQYLQIIEKMDIGAKYYKQFVADEWIEDYKAQNGNAR